MITEYIENSLYERFPSLSECKNEIETMVLMMLDTYKRGGKILLCGNENLPASPTRPANFLPNEPSHPPIPWHFFVRDRP